MASLPVVIFQFALSPYADWQQLAWTGALIITFAVLALSIIARALPPRGNRHELMDRVSTSTAPPVPIASDDRPRTASSTRRSRSAT